MNTKQLLPITGALIAGLIGVEAADCFGFTTSVCRDANSTIWVNYPNCQNPNNNDLVASGTWYAHNAFEITEPGHDEAATWADYRHCHGTASYLDCAGFPHTIYNYYDYSSQLYYEPIDDGYPPPCVW